MAGTADLGTLVLRLTADNRSFDASLLSSMARAAGFAAGVVSSITAVSAVAYKATKAYADFEDGMTKSLSIMSKEDQKFREQMEQTALQLSTQSVTAASDLAKGYYYLASAGLDAERSIKALSVANNFAISGDMKLERATEALTDSVANLGLAAKDATEYQKNMIDVSNALAQAGALSNASTEQFAIALKTKFGAALRSFNKDVYEGTAVLMAFANQGIKAENGGESATIVMRDLARTAIINRQAWSDFGVAVFDANGQMRNIPLIFTEIEDRMAAYSPEQKKAELALLGFQDRTISATNALIGMGREMQRNEELQRAVDANYAKDVAGRQMQSFSAQLKILANDIEVVGIKLAEAWMPELKAIVKVLSEMATQLAGVTDASSDMGAMGATAASAMGNALLGAAQAAVTVYHTLALIVDGYKALYQMAMKLKSATDPGSAGADAWAKQVKAGLERASADYEAAKASGASAEKLAELNAELVKYQGYARGVAQYTEEKHQFDMRAVKDGNDTIKSIEGHIAAMITANDVRAKGQQSFAEYAAGFRKEQQDRKAAQAQMDAEAAAAARYGNVINIVADAWKRAGIEQDKMLASRRSTASAKAQNIDPAIAALYTGLDPYKAQSESVNQLIRVQNMANAALEENYKLKEEGKITEAEFNRNLATQMFTLDNFATVLGGLNAKGELKDFWENGTETLTKYNLQAANAEKLQLDWIQLIADGTMSWEEYDTAVAKVLVSEDALARKRAEIMAKSIPALGQNFGRAGFDINSGFGQQGYDYSRYQNSGISGMDAMGGNLMQQQALEQAHADELKALDEFHKAKLVSETEYEDARSAMIAQHATQRRNLQYAEASLILNSAESIGDSLASIASDTAGKQSAFYKVAFAMSKAFAIADATVKIAQGIAAAAANPFPYNLAAMASVAAATASIVSNIMSVRMTSFEGGGMTKGGNRTGGVDGRGGMLSVLHPNEMVVDLDKPSNRNQGMGGNQVNITVINNAGADVETRKSDDGKNITLIVNKAVEKVASDIRTGRGSVPTALGQTYGLGRART